MPRSRAEHSMLRRDLACSRGRENPRGAGLEQGRVGAGCIEGREGLGGRPTEAGPHPVRGMGSPVLTARGGAAALAGLPGVLS